MAKATGSYVVCYFLEMYLRLQCILAHLFYLGCKLLICLVVIRVLGSIIPQLAGCFSLAYFRFWDACCFLPFFIVAASSSFLNSRSYFIPGQRHYLHGRLNLWDGEFSLWRCIGRTSYENISVFHLEDRCHACVDIQERRINHRKLSLRY